MPWFKCLNAGCPDRVEQRDSHPPRCYTCGQLMPATSTGMSRPSDGTDLVGFTAPAPVAPTTIADLVRRLDAFRASAGAIPVEVLGVGSMPEFQNHAHVVDADLRAFPLKRPSVDAVFTYTADEIRRAASLRRPRVGDLCRWWPRPDDERRWSTVRVYDVYLDGALELRIASHSGPRWSSEDGLVGQTIRVSANARIEIIP